MPPRKRYPVSIKVTLGYLEAFLLERISRLSRVGQADQVRCAIRYYAKHHRGLRPDSARDEAHNWWEPQISDEAMLREFRQDLDKFLTEDVEVEYEQPPGDSTDTFLHDQKMHFETTEETFDLD